MSEGTMINADFKICLVGVPMSDHIIHCESQIGKIRISDGYIRPGTHGSVRPIF